MRSSIPYTWLLTAASTLVPALGQTFTKCNPLQGTCPADPALGKSLSIDMTQASDQFTVNGAPTYDSNGASFTVAKSGDSPTLTSKWYMMFGHIDVVMKAAPGVGIVSTVVLQSDDLDEIDWEWLGGDNTQVQSNYFGKGLTTTYNRGAFHSNPGNHDGFHTYSVDWTADQIVWQIDGQTVRALTQASANPGQYPQTPMQLKIGIWSGGDPSNAPGTIQWAGGSTNYAAGPYTMQVKSVKATDYSTGTSYTYGDTSGNWQSIQAAGGSVKSSGNPGSPVVVSAPAVTSGSSGAPLPFDGTHLDTSSTFTTPNVYPWVVGPTTLQTAGAAPTSYPGLPSGWTVTPSGKVVPPSAAPSTSPPASSTQSLAVSFSAATLAADSSIEIVTEYNQQGFMTVVTEPAGWATMSKSYDVHGFPITVGPAAPSATGTAVRNAVSVSSGTATLAVQTGAANPDSRKSGRNAAYGGIAGALGVAVLIL